mgnify:CR=1 FL=1
MLTLPLSVVVTVRLPTVRDAVAVPVILLICVALDVEVADAVTVADSVAEVVADNDAVAVSEYDAVAVPVALTIDREPLVLCDPDTVAVRVTLAVCVMVWPASLAWARS